MKTPKLFTDFALSNRKDKLTAIIWRLLKCDHDTQACLDLRHYEYCFRCHTKV